MTTTTIRLPEDLKARIAKAAEAAGTSAHNVILEAIAEKAELAEQRLAFRAVADQRHAQFLESGERIAWDDARTCLKQWLADQRTKRPAASKQAR